jgi:hypothetical protein
VELAEAEEVVRMIAKTRVPVYKQLAQQFLQIPEHMDSELRVNREEKDAEEVEVELAQLAVSEVHGQMMKLEEMENSMV